MPFWFEPTLSLRNALTELGWEIRLKLPLPASWPVLEEEPPLAAEVVLTPRSGEIPDDSFFTDGSVGIHGGGAAAVAVTPKPTTGAGSILHLPSPRSATHCELVAIRMAVRSGAKAIFSDSLAALATIRDWRTWPVRRQLRCVDRAEVRAILHHADGQLGLLEKVKAHRTDEEAFSDPKALWNEAVDKEAKLAASANSPLWDEQSCFSDPVQMVGENGEWILNVPNAILARWWSIGRSKAAERRPDTLGLLYPAGVEFDWHSSNRAFRAPFVRGDQWIFLVSRASLKWTARARCGALASTARRSKTDGRAEIIPDPICPLCGTAVEDDIHMITSCPATHTASVLEAITNVWRASLRALGAPDALPSLETLRKWALQLAVGLIPMDILSFFGDRSKRTAFFGKISIGMIEWFGARMKERELLRVPPSSPPQASSLRPVSVLPLGPVPSSERTRLWRLRQSINLSSWVSLMGPEVIVDPTSVEAAPAEALMLLWEREFGIFPSAGDYAERVRTWVRALKKAFLEAGEPFSLFAASPRVQAFGEQPPKEHVFFPVMMPSAPEFISAWERFVKPSHTVPGEHLVPPPDHNLVFGGTELGHKGSMNRSETNVNHTKRHRDPRWDSPFGTSETSRVHQRPQSQSLASVFCAHPQPRKRPRRSAPYEGAPLSARARVKWALEELAKERKLAESFLSLCSTSGEGTSWRHCEGAAQLGTAHSRRDVTAHGRATVGSAMTAQDGGSGAVP